MILIIQSYFAGVAVIILISVVTQATAHLVKRNLNQYALASTSVTQANEHASPARETVATADDNVDDSE